MTDAELQVAIDKTAQLAKDAPTGAVREVAQKHLQELMKVQAIRAGQLHAPGIRPGCIMEVHV